MLVVVVIEVRAEVIRNKIRAIGKMAHVFQVLRYVRPHYHSSLTVRGVVRRGPLRLPPHPPLADPDF